MIDISKKYMAIVKDILWQHVPNCEVRAFGSRVTGETKNYSDLDLVIMGPGVDAKGLRHLKEAFEESRLPFRVDVLDWNSIPGSFKKIISARYEVIQTPLKP